MSYTNEITKIMSMKDHTISIIEKKTLINYEL